MIVKFFAFYLNFMFLRTVYILFNAHFQISLSRCIVSQSVKLPVGSKSAEFVCVLAVTRLRETLARCALAVFLSFTSFFFWNIYPALLRATFERLRMQR